jgi:hypothetical protein
MLLVLVLLFAALRLRLLEIPLERDEGDYAHIAQLLLQGVPPYAAAYDMRLPGIFAAYALILRLRTEPRGRAAGAAAPQRGHDRPGLPTRGSSRRCDGRAATAGLAAAAGFGALSLCPAALGFTANTEHFLLLPALCSGAASCSASRC